jgi:hypothetical protein
VAVSFRIHSELYVLMDTVQVVKEVPQPVGSVWPDNESVVDVPEPAEVLMGIPVEHHLVEIVHEKYWR